MGEFSKVCASVHVLRGGEWRGGGCYTEDPYIWDLCWGPLGRGFSHVAGGASNGNVVFTTACFAGAVTV